LLFLISFHSFFWYPATDTDGDEHQRQQTTRANHAVFDPIFIQYIITGTAWNTETTLKGNLAVPTKVGFDHQQAATRCAPIEGSSFGAHLEVYLSR
jgi:hypothetical protein